MPLTNVFLKNAKPTERPWKKADGHGLFIMINPNGSKLWRYKYRFHGKQKTLALGAYPVVSQANARKRHWEARQQLAAGIDPSAARKAERAATQTSMRNTFEVVAREWIKKQAGEWSDDHTERVRHSLEVDVFPDLGKRPIADIDAPELLAVLRKIEKRGALETLSKVKQRCGAVFRYGITTGRCKKDIAADLRDAFSTRTVRHHASLSESELPEFFACLDVYDGDRRTAWALELVLLTLVRTADLRKAVWSEFDLPGAVWRIPASRMKMKEQHIVSLSRQALAILARLEPGAGLVLPSLKKPSIPISENTLLFAMYRMGYHGRATVHGLRGTASTILNEQGWRADVIERQLAHGERNNVRKAYNHAEYLTERREMLQAWADYLDSLKRGARVVPIGRGA